mmetsp:Transcript_30876/g.51368  ORF Transcript_30876/g.51368 Transcript_30876/m.51368 type:complete len:227 (-) Transcript_30876:1016-1696(-)
MALPAIGPTLSNGRPVGPSLLVVGNVAHRQPCRDWACPTLPPTTVVPPGRQVGILSRTPSSEKTTIWPKKRMISLVPLEPLMRTIHLWKWSPCRLSKTSLPQKETLMETFLVGRPHGVRDTPTTHTKQRECWISGTVDITEAVIDKALATCSSARQVMCVRQQPMWETPWHPRVPACLVLDTAFVNLIHLGIKRKIRISMPSGRTTKIVPTVFRERASIQRGKRLC